MHYTTFLVFISFFTVFASCEYNSDVSIPAYISIDRISLQHEEAIGITDAWVYLNGNLQGVYELPAEFPIIGEGENKISIYSGINVNGVSATKSYYPFYTPHVSTINLVPGETTKIYPHTSYQSWTKIELVDDFEQLSSRLNLGTTSDTSIIRMSGAIEGNYCGRIAFDSTHTVFNATTKIFSIPDLKGTSSGMYLELNFKSDVFVKIGLFVKEDYPLVLLQPNDEWRKIYIDLYTTLVKESTGSGYFIYFEADKPQSMDEAEVWLDNIKIVYPN